MSHAALPLTKIITTLGPASSDEAVLRRLIETGASIVRLNFSHGSLDDHAALAGRVRGVATELRREVAVLGDLRGPKIRIGEVEEGGALLEPGDRVIFQRQPCVARRGGPPVRFSTTYPGLVDDVRIGERVLINDGAIRLLVISRDDDDSFTCRVTVGGRVTSGKGINLPESEIHLSSLTDRDRECVKWAVEHEIDFLALSFVRTAQEVRGLRDLIRQSGGDLPIIAKIEQPRAVANIESILSEADAIMVARGDLGVEMELARVPVIQTRLIQQAQAHGKPVIVATQMLESMIESPAPTRAEVSDVANAIFAEVDAVMLSGETAVGKHPALAVEYMRQTAVHAEAHIATLPPRPSPPVRLQQERYRTAALAHGVWTIAQDTGARLIAVWSQTGGGARILSQNNFRIPILAASSDERAVRRMQLLRGVTPVLMRAPESLAAFTRRIDDLILEQGWAKRGEFCILAAGSPLETPRNTNAIAIHEVGNETTGFANG